MKKKFLVFTVASSFLLLTTGCGGSSSDAKDTKSDSPVEANNETEEEEEDATEVVAPEPAAAAALDFSSSQEASDAYKSLLEEYQTAMADGDANAEELKTQLEEIMTYSKGKFQSAELKAMSDLSKFALKIGAGQKVDLDKAFKAYGKAFDAMKELGGKDVENATKAMKSALKGAAGAYGAADAYGDALDELDDY